LAAVVLELRRGVVKNFLFFNKRQQPQKTTHAVAVVHGGARIDQQPELIWVVVSRDSLFCALVIMNREPQLFEIVLAGTLPSGLAGCLYRGQEQAYERADDRNHDQEFDKRKTAEIPLTRTPIHHFMTHTQSSPHVACHG